jgi:uncharacterized membrane protein HdeD (DUF308 family)
MGAFGGNTNVSEEREDAETILRLRFGLIAVGLVLAVTGALCFWAPAWISAPAELLIGGAMLVTGLLEVGSLVLSGMSGLGSVWTRHTTRVTVEPEGSLVLGSSSGSSSGSSRSTVWGLVVLQLILGGAIVFWPQTARVYLGLALVLAVAVEGLLILWASVHFSSSHAKLAMWLSGLTSLVVAVAALVYWGEALPVRWVGYLIGSKLLLMGVTFLWIGGRAKDSELRLAYIGLSQYQESPQEGSIYAVFYGPAFHCGISVGQNQIVDYLTDGVVRLIPWEEFLLGRRAMEWNYPDVEAGSPSEISAFARSLAGGHTKYDALRFNCENLAIHCRSLGKTQNSAFSQAAVSTELVQAHPWVGSLVQVLHRGASWFLYGMGGPFGKKVGFAMIRLTRALTDWLVVRPLRKGLMAEGHEVSS